MPPAEQHWSELVRGLTHPQPPNRARAARELGKLGPAAVGAMPALLAAINDSEASVREAAVQAVAHFGADALQPLVQLLTSHPDKYVRRNAVWGLGKLGLMARPALSAVSAALNDPDPRTASGAAQALGNMGPLASPAIPALTEAMQGTNVVLCRLAAKALSQVGPAAVPTLLVHLRHHDPFVRGEAAMAIGWIGAAAAVAVPALMEMVKAGIPVTARATSQYALAGSGRATPLTPPPATEAGSAEEASRIAAVTALGRIGPAAAPAIWLLTSVAEETDEQLRTAAEHALRLIQGF